jgi:hypothetical protein
MQAVVKLYRRQPEVQAADTLVEMVGWERSLPAPQRSTLASCAAWPLALVTSRSRPVGIVMRDLSDRFTTPFVMPSGRHDSVLLALEHLLGADGYLRQRGLPVLLDTELRLRVAARIAGTLAFMHQHGVVVGDIAPSNVLVRFGDAGPGAGPEVCLIDCDSMVFRGRQALATVETSDWNVPGEFGESGPTRATDAYKLGLVVLRLLARSHDARTPVPHLRQVPIELRDLLYRALSEVSANRPAAGEWQRSLQLLLMQTDLSSRYPAPVSARVQQPSQVATRVPAAIASAGLTGPPPVVRLRPGRRAVAGAVRQPPQQPVSPRSGGLLAAALAPSNRRLRRVVLALWMLALAAVIVLVVSRLVTAATPARALTQTVYYQQPSGAQNKGAEPGP